MTSLSRGNQRGQRWERIEQKQRRNRGATEGWPTAQQCSAVACGSVAEAVARRWRFDSVVDGGRESETERVRKKKVRQGNQGVDIGVREKEGM